MASTIDLEVKLSAELKQSLDEVCEGLKLILEENEELSARVLRLEEILSEDGK